MNEIDLTLPAYLDRSKPKPLVYTYTMLNTWLICPEQCYRRFIKKDIPFQATKEMQYGTEVHTALEYRIGGKKPLPDAMRQWEPYAAALDNVPAKVEVKLGVDDQGQPCAFFGDNVWLRGKADVLVVDNRIAFLLDHKTGKKREDPFELEVQALMVHAIHPTLSGIYGAYGWLRENTVGQQHDLFDVRGTWAKINNIVEEIADSIAGNEFEKKKTPLCNWCSVLDCEHNPNRG